MVQIDIAYRGELRCEASHAPSLTTVVTDAPLDNHGLGKSFSPTDLLATALGTCMLTIMGIVARKHGWDLQGATASVVKHMAQDPVRRVGKLAWIIHEDARPTQQLGSWRGFARFAPGVDPVGSSRTANFAKCRQGPRASRRRAFAKLGVGLHELCRLEVALCVPGEWDAGQRDALVAAAKTCPVACSLGESVEVLLDVTWG